MKQPSEKERFTVLLEDVHSQFKVVTEHVVQLKDDVGIIKQDLKAVKKTVEEHSIKLIVLQKDVNTLKKDVSEIKSELIPVKSVLSQHEHRLNDQEKRVKKLEIAR